MGGLLWAIKERLGLLLLVAIPAWLTGLAALILTVSRGAWLGVGAGLLAMGYLLLRRRLVRQRTWRLVLDLLAVRWVCGAILASTAWVRESPCRWVELACSVLTGVVTAILWRKRGRRCPTSVVQDQLWRRRAWLRLPWLFIHAAGG